MSDLARRLLTAAILLPAVLLLIHTDRRLLAALVAVVSVLGVHEMARLARRGRNLEIPVWLTAPGAVLLVASCGGFVALGPVPALLLVLFSSLGFTLVQPRGSMIARPASIVFTALYVGFLPAHLLRFYELGIPGMPDPWPVTYALFLVWGSDTGAYAIGRLVGGPKLCPRISPGKTWAGAIGGLLVSIGLAVAFGGWVRGLSLPGRIGAGLLASLFGQVGDCAESMMKREADVKDSGRFIPGHGGILDRLDSLILALPVLFYWLRWSLRAW